MAALPTGTVTFLFTDIEGSTRRWDEQPEAMQQALARHDAILREAIERRGGHVFETVGDASCAVFAVAAAVAAVAAERAVREEPWPSGTGATSVRRSTASRASRPGGATAARCRCRPLRESLPATSCRTASSSATWAGTGRRTSRGRSVSIISPRGAFRPTR